MKRLPLVLPLLVLSIFASSLHAAYSIAQVLDAPFASLLTASPKGARVVWLINAGGKRNLYAAEAPAWVGRPLTQFNEDDGQEIDEIAWAPDGNSVYFVRGGDFESGRENPNPGIKAALPDQSIWMVKIEEGKPLKLGEGKSPAVSPNGDLVAFIKKGELWTMAPDGKNAASTLAVQGKIETVRWSPDGSALAFVNDRTTHSLIGVYRPSDHSLRYLDPSVDADTEPVWSPDSRRIVFLRIPASSTAFMFGPKREAEPFSIRVADVASGKGHEVWHADAGQGSVFHPIVSESQLHWAAGDRLIFPWEQTGFEGLYTVSVDGGKLEALTPGEAEVEHVFLSPDRKTVYYSTNLNDVDRRHIWKVAAAGRPPQPVTSGHGIEWGGVECGDGSVVTLASDERHMSHAAAVSKGELKDLAPTTLPADFPAADLVTPQQVILTAADGMSIHGQLFLPPGLKAGEKRPALVFFHGGSRRQMLLGFHYMYYYSNAYAMNQYLASQGYIVLAVNYRSGIGYGMKFREALNYGATGASEYNDVVGAGLYLKNRPDVDPARIGLWGGSYGGYLTALGLARASDLFAAGVDFHGVHDWNNVIRNFVPAYDPAKQAAAAKLAYESSPLSSVTTWRSPVLLIHGDDDRNVPFDETVLLVEALRKQKVYFEQLIFPNEIHDFLLYRDWLAAYEASADFFKRKMK
ncbi:MAG: prolyl oligopeptidase family serine peptidase [Bryobacteraceae bacterium]